MATGPGIPAPLAPPPRPPISKVAKGALEVDLPAGGRLALNDADEVQFWERTAQRYISDYGLTKVNEQVILGAILSQGVSMYRAQKALADPKKATNAVGQITKASEQIRELEKALGIDKKTREAGGQHTVSDFVTRLKRAGHEKGVRIAERTKAYEAFVMELRWKLRLMRNGDDEDRAVHNLTPDSILSWAETELAKLDAEEQAWAHQKGKVFVGRL